MRSAATWLAVCIGASVAAVLAACTSILGIDESFTQAPTDGGFDTATTDATMAGGGGATDGSAAGKGDGGILLTEAGLGDASVANAWHLDLSYGDAGYYELAVDKESVYPQGLTLLEGPDGGVTIVGVSVANGGGANALFYTATDAGALLALRPLDPLDYHLAGALEDPDGAFYLVLYGVDQSGLVVQGYGADFTALANTAATVAFDGLSSKISGTGGRVTLPGGTSGTAVEFTLDGGNASVTAIPASSSGPRMSVLESTLVVGSKTYYAGSCEGCTAGADQAVYATSDNGSISAGSVGPTPAEASALMALVATTSGSVFGVGFADSAIFAAPVPSSASVATSAIDVGFDLADNAGDYYGDQVQMDAVVDARDEILVGTTAGGPTLVAFGPDGQADRTAFAQPHLQAGQPSYLATFPLPTTGVSDEPDWQFESMLLQGNLLYVTCSTGDDHGGAGWVVFRLVYGPLAP